MSHQLRQHMNRQRPPERDYGHLEAVAQALARGLSALDMGTDYHLLDQAPGREPAYLLRLRNNKAREARTFRTGFGVDTPSNSRP